MKKTGFVLNGETGYFENQGVNVMAFDDIYPEGHQAGVSVLMHGRRMATNGDLRFEPTPGQFQPIPRQEERKLCPEENAVSAFLRYPDTEKHLRQGRGASTPLIYPDYPFSYEVRVQGGPDGVTVTVNLDQPIPERYAGRLSFNLEMFPGELIGRPYLMDGQAGVFPPQPNGPTQARPGNLDFFGCLPAENSRTEPTRLAGDGTEYSPIRADDLIAVPYAVGHRFTFCPDDPERRMTVESEDTELRLFDGRMNHNNGWFVLSSPVPAGKAEAAVVWKICPNVVDGWRYAPVVQVSQVGYHPDQPKVAVIEGDKNDESLPDAVLCRLTETGETPVFSAPAAAWGPFLRYRYARFDFSHIKEEGMYRVRCGGSVSAWFRIARDVFDRGVWQPVLEYFLPIQMCHMRVSEKYRVWHGLCHTDDAHMAPVDFDHIDGYRQGPETYTVFRPGDRVPGLDAGGWHDAGDFDLRIESQAGECALLAAIFEEFHLYYDETAVDQARKTVEIHQPDGKNDLLQQLEHGLLSVLGAYRALGRPYRGIICPSLRQYVLLGDPAAMTDGVPGNDDDRWVFTEENPARDLQTAAQLAASARAMRGFNDALGAEAMAAAKELYARTEAADDRVRGAKIHAAAELFLATGEDAYREYLLSNADFIASSIGWLGWVAAKAVHVLSDEAFTETIRRAMTGLRARYDEMSGETPYGIPYRPHIWGAGWEIQRLGYQYYFLHKAFPDIFGPELLFRALDFILGCHPGSNTASFASGVGTKSATVAYGFNRADWTYIPGGVVSGTALIRPDFPELKEFPFLWQQTEYVMGGGSTHFMFLVLAVRELLENP